MLAAGCATAEDRAPFYTPGTGSSDPDGGEQMPDGGMDRDGGGGGGIAGGSSTAMPDPVPTFEMSGDPSTFDPDQVYVHGLFDNGGSIDAKDTYADFCESPVSAIADWSSPDDDWRTDQGITVGLACEHEDPQIRVDGSIVYMHAKRFVLPMKEEVTTIDGSTVMVTPPARLQDNETGQALAEIWAPNPTAGFQYARHFLHPQTGDLVWVTWDTPLTYPDSMSMLPFLHMKWAGKSDLNQGDLVPVPEGFIIAHLGYGDHALVHRYDGPDDMGILSGESDLVEFSAADFGFAKIQAVRATEDGFLLLVVQSNSPATLELWSVSYLGELTQLATSMPVTNLELDEGNCPLRGGDFGGEPIDRLPLAGCMCVLDGDGNAVCLAREGVDGPEVVVRFDLAQADAAPEIVYRLTDDPFLTSFLGLITGP